MFNNNGLNRKGIRKGREVLAGVVSAAVIGGVAPAYAEDLESWLNGDYATGDWGGMRTKLKEAGITPEAAYTTDILAVHNGNADGNSNSDGWDYAGRIDFGINFDFEKLAGLTGFSLYASGAWSSGHNLSDRQVGNLFAVQQIYTGQEARLSQLYVQQKLFDDQLAIKIGRLTTEEDFLSSDIYANYVNGGINGTPANIPGGNYGFTTAPFAQWGAVIAGEPAEGLRIAGGVYNTNQDSIDDHRNGTDFSLDPEDGVLGIFEVGYGWNQAKEEFEVTETPSAAEAGGQPVEASTPTSASATGGLPGMFKVGFLYESGHREDVDDGRSKDGNPGFYFSLQQMVYREPGTTDQGLTPWGVATFQPRQSINELPVFLAGGLVYKGLIPGRDDDNAAIGVIYGKLTTDTRPSGSETVLETAYTVQLTPWFYVRPDVQVVFNPAGVSGADPAVVGGGEIGIIF